jgi:predicted amidohydrolase YtcJ
MKKIILIFAYAFVVGFCANAQQTHVARHIFVNGQIFTAYSGQDMVSAIAVAADTIIYAGSNEQALALKGPDTQVTDLKGAFAMPGLIEGHGHFNGLGNSLQMIDLSNSRSWEEVVQVVASKARDLPPGVWIKGRGWHQEKWKSAPVPAVDAYPFHDLLSLKVPDHPVLLEHASGHALLANSKAMEMAGVQANTPDPEGGRIVRDKHGKMAGVFEENATLLIERTYEAWRGMRGRAQSREMFESTARLAASECLRHGVTSFQDAGCSFWELDQYARMAESGRLNVRLWSMAAQPRPSETHLLAQYPKVNVGNGFFTCRAVKCYMDGALGSYGAWLLQPYEDKKGFTGQNLIPIDSIKAVAAACRQYGLQCCVHAIGDRGNRETLNIFEEVLKGDRKRRWRIEHAQHLDPLDISRFSQLGVIASMQTIHCTSDAPFVEKRLGKDRARKGAYVWRRLLKSGASLANGTDTPVEKLAPLHNIYAAVTRKRADDGMVFYRKQRLTRKEALLSYTVWNAYAAFEEHKKGMLRAGYYVDMAVFDTNLLTCPDEALLSAKAIMTVVGGDIKWQE